LVQIGLFVRAIPVGRGSDGDARAFVAFVEGVDVSGWGARNGGDEDPVAAAEADSVVGVGFDGVAAFVDEAVVVPAEEDEVVEAGVAAVGPVLAVVGVEVAAVRAAGPLAGCVVARFECAAEAWRDGAACAADGGRPPRCVASPSRWWRRSRAAGRFRGR